MVRAGAGAGADQFPALHASTIKEPRPHIPQGRYASSMQHGPYNKKAQHTHTHTPRTYSCTLFPARCCTISNCVCSTCCIPVSDLDTYDRIDMGTIMQHFSYTVSVFIIFTTHVLVGCIDVYLQKFSTIPRYRTFSFLHSHSFFAYYSAS